MDIMSYQVLARKLRPADFTELVGQDHVVRALCHGLDHDRLHHAYLFTGTRGVGKTTIARILAKSLNCEQGVSSKPCGGCSICLEIAENRFVDLIEVDAASRTRVDDTRELLENAQYLPTRGRYKVYLIDEVHMLSASSFNALLKTLEEPPAHVKFLLATTDPKKVPVTVLSRCLQFQLKNISNDGIVEYLGSVLKTENVAAEPAALEIIARAAAGSMRDALSITDQAVAYGAGEINESDLAEMLGLVGRNEVAGLLQALAAADVAKLLAVTDDLASRGTDFAALLGEIVAEFHSMAVDHALGTESALGFGAETVQLYYQIALMGYRDMQIVPDPKSGFEMTLLRMLAFAPSADLANIPSAQGAQSTQTDAATNSAAEPKASAAVDAAPRASAAVDAAPEAHMRDGRAWHEVVDALSLSGVARMIAEHSILKQHANGSIELTLDDAHDTLLNEAQRAAIERALSDDLQGPIQLQIVVAGVAQETPARRRERQAAERQRNAEMILESDQTVQSLLNEFGGRLDVVKPIEDAPDLSA
jgi:DNA polymerase-3 subunit gamma/tau